MKTTHLTVCHLDGTFTYYEVGDDVEFKSWEMKAHGLTLKRHDGTRIHILAGSMAHVDVQPSHVTRKHVHRWGDWIPAGILPDGNWEYVRQCFAGDCQEMDTTTYLKLQEAGEVDA